MGIFHPFCWTLGGPFRFVKSCHSFRLGSFLELLLLISLDFLLYIICHLELFKFGCWISWSGNLSFFICHVFFFLLYFLRLFLNFIHQSFLMCLFWYWGLSSGMLYIDTPPFFSYFETGFCQVSQSDLKLGNSHASASWEASRCDSALGFLDFLILAVFFLNLKSFFNSLNVF